MLAEYILAAALEAWADTYGAHVVHFEVYVTSSHGVVGTPEL